MKTGAMIITEGTLRLSRAPAEDLAGCAMLAQKAAGLERADFIVIAVEPGTATDKLGTDLQKLAAGTK